MAVIATVEDTMTAAAQQALGTGFKVETVPAGITAEEWGQRLRSGTAVYIAWTGGGVGTWRGTPRILGEFSAYVISESAGKEVIRRRGNPDRLGAYLMIEYLVPAIHDLAVDGIGTLQLDRIDNLYSEQFDKLGIAVYQLAFNIPIEFGPVAQSTLSDFLRFNPQFDPNDAHQNTGPLPAPPQNIGGEDLITLPGAD